MTAEQDLRWFQLLTAASRIWAGGDGAPVAASAIVAPPDRLIALGVNGLPAGLSPEPGRLDRSRERALWCEHSERAVLYHALANGAGVRGATLYSTLFPCADCMRGIVMAGIATVVTPVGAEPSDEYRQSVEVAARIAQETRINLRETVLPRKGQDALQTL